ncbi:hypothetical protein SAMN05216215_106831 [Saccharopolyspora shandongensis]|uniref:Uncharacterized protein n=1 Tax=Saccharopolyspora shandongensis TaxID=418495 RepID=A0A1H3SQN1_9PSEU|nr:hypothetical protein SAMN05216215_106831 [Saccharopolyspora shandongensis]
MPGAGHLHPNTTTADDGEPPRYGVGVGALAIGPRPGLGNAGQVRQRRAAAGADGHRMPSGEHHAPILTGLDGHLPGPVQPPVAANQIGTDPPHPVRLPVVMPARHEPVAAGERRRRVDRRVDDLPRALDSAGIGYRDHRTQQRLAGNTCPIRTFPTDQLALDHRHAQSRSTAALGHGLAHRTRADHHHVIATRRRASSRLDAHGLPLRASSAPPKKPLGGRGYRRLRSSPRLPPAGLISAVLAPAPEQRQIRWPSRCQGHPGCAASQFCSNVFAQARALAFGKTELRGHRTGARAAPRDGGQPSHQRAARRKANPRLLGCPVALYERKSEWTLCAGCRGALAARRRAGHRGAVPLGCRRPRAHPVNQLASTWHAFTDGVLVLDRTTNGPTPVRASWRAPSATQRQGH